jgi:hypothetical protein
MDDVLRTARRASAGRSVLGWVALACLILNGAFWGSLMLDLLAPAKLLSPQTIQAGLSIAAFALVLPLAWSSLLPNSPAMRLLQRQSWHLPGQLAITAAAVFLTWLAASWLHLWWKAQPTIAEAGQALFLTISSLIAGTLVPALSWAAMTPEQWIAQVEQARQVKRLEWALKMEEAAMRATYARAVALLNAGLSNLTIEQRREVGGILAGFARTQQNALAAVGQSWKQMYGVEAELGLIDDKQLVEQYATVVNTLADGCDAMAETADYVYEAPALAAPTGRPDHGMMGRTACTHQTAAPHQDTADRVPGTAMGRRDGGAPGTTRGPYGDHGTTDRIVSQAYEAAYSTLRGAWKRSDLEEALSVSKTQAHRYIQEWIASGDIIKLDEPKDHYQFTGVN